MHNYITRLKIDWFQTQCRSYHCIVPLTFANQHNQYEYNMSLLLRINHLTISTEFKTKTTKMIQSINNKIIIGYKICTAHIARNINLVIYFNIIIDKIHMVKNNIYMSRRHSKNQTKKTRNHCLFHMLVCSD